MSESARYETVIGLEVHAQLLTCTKIFCGCSTAFGAPPNSNVCPVCLGLPGALPVLNEQAVRLAVRAAVALGCSVRETSRFARKNYFYPDSPKGYQISQFDEPFSEHGHLDLGETVSPEARDDAGTKAAPRVRILRIHMEEDAGKTVHDRGDDSLVDLNRSGVPLIEVVSEPDLRSAADAVAYLRILRDVLVFAGVNDGNLEEGSFRCDANVSIRRVGDTKLGTRVELKNINSFRFVEKAIASEVERQVALVEAGDCVLQETRGWNEFSGTTFSLRSKEAAQDYRYFPEPDLPPLILDEHYVARVQRELPELPREKRDRFVRAFGLSRYAAGVLTQHPRIAAFFEEAATLHGDPVKISNFIQSEVLRDVVTHGLTADIPVTARQVAELLKLDARGTISGKQAKEVYAKMRGTHASPGELVKELGMVQVSDAAVLEATVTKVLAVHAKQADAVLRGKVSVLGFLVGAVMKETKGSANPALVNEILKRRLGVT
jgi:aspartyl-tRNA(Asn)/glutamyl-tRNA(Gln) amidotransferase subunit B